MWVLIGISNNKLYQDGKEVKEIKLSNNIIIDIVERSPGVFWVKIGD